MSTKGKHLGPCAHHGERHAAALKRAALRVTQPRLAVMDALSHSARPLMPKDIYEGLARTSDGGDGLASIDLVSIYRIVEALVGAGLAHQAFPSGGYLLCERTCEADTESAQANVAQACAQHVLLSCRHCGKTTELNDTDDVTRALMERVHALRDFQPDIGTVHLDGLCRSCAHWPK